MTEEQESVIIRMAWEDRTTFDHIREHSGLTETQVIKLMRASLKPSSFRLWRKRVTGKLTKHRKLFKANRQALKSRAWLSETE